MFITTQICSLLLLQVYYSIRTKHMKIIMHTCNSLVKPTFINSLLIRIPDHFAQYRHSNVTINIQRLEPLKVCSNPIDLFMH